MKDILIGVMLMIVTIWSAAWLHSWVTTNDWFCLPLIITHCGAFYAGGMTTLRGLEM